MAEDAARELEDLALEDALQLVHLYGAPVDRGVGRVVVVEDVFAA